MKIKTRLSLEDANSIQDMSGRQPSHHAVISKWNSLNQQNIIEALMGTWEPNIRQAASAQKTPTSSLKDSQGGRLKGNRFLHAISV